MGSMEGTTMLPFSDVVDAPNEDYINVCDSDPPPTAKKTVDTPFLHLKPLIGPFFLR